MNKKDIEDELLKMGISPSLLGFRCIRDIMQMYIEDDVPVKVSAYYQIIGARIGITDTAVDRAVRYAIHSMPPKCELYGKKNSEFFARFKLILDRKKESK